MSGQWGLSAENRVGEMGQWVWLEREGEDPSSGLQNDLRRVRLEKPLGDLRAIVVTQWKKTKNLILLEVYRKPLKQTKGTVTGDLTRLHD